MSRERLVLLGAPPRAAVVACEILRAELGVLAETFERNQHAHRSFGGVQALGHGAAELLELLGVGAHEQVLRVVAEEFAVQVALGQHLARPEIYVVDGSGHDHLRQTRGARACQSRFTGGIDPVGDEIGKLVGGDVDDAGKIARGRKPLQRPAADARGVKLNHLVAQGFEPLAHVIDAGRRAAERGDREEWRMGGLRFSPRCPVFGLASPPPTRHFP